MSTITTTLTPYTTTPSRQNPSTFSADMDTRNSEMETNLTESNEVIEQTNIVNSEINANAQQVSADKDEVANNKQIVEGYVNYKGDWIPNYNVVGYQLNDSVSYTDGYNYVSKITNNLAEPVSLTNDANWNFVENVDPNNYYLKTETYNRTEADNLLNDKADLDSPSFINNPTAPTQTQGDNSTKLATTAFVQANQTPPQTGVLSVNNLLHIQDQKPTGTSAGSSSAGVQTRTLNTILVDNVGITLNANVIESLPIGDYYAEILVPACRPNTHKGFLYNVTDANNELIGTSEKQEVSADNQSWSKISESFSIATIKDFEIRQYINQGVASYGLGQAVSDGATIEIYTDVKIWKVG